jgi:hypothetical protein
MGWGHLNGGDNQAMSIIFFAKKTFESYKKDLAIRSFPRYTLRMTTTLTNYHKMSNVEIAEALAGCEVFYLADKSKTTATLHRYFKILEVEHVAIAAKTGLRYVTAKVIDHDNGDIEAHKNLRLQDLDVLA